MGIRITKGSKKGFDQYIITQNRKIENALIYRLSFALEELINHAKSSAGYNFQTGNLNSSIGGAVLKNGRPVEYKGFEGTNIEGEKKGKAYLNSLLPMGSDGYTVVVVAGMEYASYVENYYQLNVLAKSELLMGEKIKWAFKTIRV